MPALVINGFVAGAVQSNAAYALQNKYKIRVASSPEEAEAMRLQAQQQQQQQQQAGGQQGVLVAQS